MVAGSRYACSPSASGSKVKGVPHIMKSSLEKSGEPVKKNGFQVSPHKVNVTKNGFPLIGTGTLKMQSRGIDLGVGKDPSRFEGQKVSGGRFENFEDFFIEFLKE